MADRRGRARTRFAAPLLAGLLTLGLVACSSSAPASPTVAPATALPTELSTILAPATSAPTTEETTPAPTSAAAGPACAATDLKASHDLVEGAAGSRLTTVVLVASRSCSVDLYPAMSIRDGDGTELVASTTRSGRIDLDPDASYSSDVRLANWCGPEPTFPLGLVIRIGAGELEVTGSSYPEAGDLPPCNGGGGSVLEATAWAAAP